MSDNFPRRNSCIKCGLLIQKISLTITDKGTMINLTWFSYQWPFGCAVLCCGVEKFEFSLLRGWATVLISLYFDKSRTNWIGLWNKGSAYLALWKGANPFSPFFCNVRNGKMSSLDMFGPAPFPWNNFSLSSWTGHCQHTNTKSHKWIVSVAIYKNHPCVCYCSVSGSRDLWHKLYLFSIHHS